MTQVRLFLEKLGANFQIYTIEQLFDLVSTRNHPAYIKRHRALLNIDRIRFFSIIFFLFISLWIAYDFLILTTNRFQFLATIKVAAISLLFVLIWPQKKYAGPLLSRVLLAIFLGIFPFIFLASSYQLSIRSETESDRLMIQLYAMLPYMSVAGLGLFPLTVFETLAYAVPLSTFAIVGWGYFADYSLAQMLPSVWLLSLMIGLAVVSSAMQLQDMISLVSRPVYDPLTGKLSRQSGIASMARDFQSSLLHDNPFSIVLIELEDLDTISKTYDPQSYDRIIFEAADILGEDLRSNDTLVRWSDKVFLLILTNTDCSGVKVTIDRLRKIGVGTLPDGQPITTGIGAAERILDQVSDWHSLIELADQRLQEAQRQGRDNSVYCGDRSHAAKSLE